MHPKLDKTANAILDALNGSRGIALVVRGRRDGTPSCAVITGRCPLCIDGLWFDDEYRELKKRSAHIALPSLDYRCSRAECPAGGDNTGYRENGRAVGLPLAEWASLLKVTDFLPDIASLNHGQTPGGNMNDKTTGSSGDTRAGEATATAVLQTGHFYRSGNDVFFVEQKSGEPVRVPSKKFEAAVARICNLKRGSADFKTVLASAVDLGFARATRARIELTTGRGDDGALLCHLGAGEVRRWDGVRFSRVVNGTGGVLFQTEPQFGPIPSKDLSAAAPVNPERFPTLHNVILDSLPPPGGPLSPAEQRALVMGAWVGPFVAPFATARPAAILVGPPGCGKTTTQRLMVKAFYGAEGEVGGGVALDRAMKDIAAGAANQSFVVRDDVNDLPAGAIDALCRICTGTKFQIAAFHETLAMASYTSRAQLLLSAVAPTWLDRSDLMSRLWIIEFAKGPSGTISERDRVERVLASRAAIWAETLLALRVLAVPPPARVALSRFDDFERVLFPIIERAGYGQALASALKKMPTVAVVIAAKSSPFLGALLALAHRLDGREVLAAELADVLAEVQGVRARDREPHSASSGNHSALTLAKLLTRVEREGSAVVTVTSRVGHNNTRLYVLTPKVNLPGGLGGVESGSIFDQQEEERRSAPSGPAGTPLHDEPPEPPNAEALH